MILSLPYVWFWAVTKKAKGILVPISASVLIMTGLAGMLFVHLSSGAQSGLVFLYIIPIQFIAVAYLAFQTKTS